LAEKRGRLLALDPLPPLRRHAGGDGHRVIVVSGVALAQYTVGDRMAEVSAMVGLVE
jgi:hypothetical protein